jgi:hypothetical protein
MALCVGLASAFCSTEVARRWRRVTIALSSQLKTDLDRYAEVHAQTWGDKVDVPTLIPYMLDTFIARDRAFCKNSSSTT